ncbi:retrovirus-related pol polyprotein from transposon TNT 1-94 [Tanacetum coccineum]
MSLITSKERHIREPIWYLDSGCSRSMTSVKSYLHKYVEQPGPKFDDKQGTIFNAKKEIVLIALRRNGVYVLDMSSLTPNGACFFPKALESVKQIRTDNGIEFRNHKLESFCDEKGISQNFSSPYTPKQNGVAERKNKTLIEAARTMLNGPVLSKHLWTDADHLGKFDAKANDGYFLGYSSVSKAFRVYNTRRQQIEETYHVTFDESIEAIRFTNTSVDEIGIDDSSRYPPDEFLKDDPSRQYQVDSDVSYYIIPHGHSLTKITQENYVPEVVAPNEPEIPHTKDTEGNNTEVSGSIIKPLVPDVTQSHITNQASTSSHPVPQDRCMAAKLTAASASKCLFVDFISEIETKKVSEAVKNPRWIDAMQEELNQFYRNKVWTLVPLPYGKIAIGSKWVFKNKKVEHGTTTKNKARLVTQGYSQEEGIAYDETFAPVARMEAIRIFLAFSTYMNIKVYQMDVKSAFLNGKLKEEVYVKQPPGFESSEFPNYVCKLDKALYGLKQAPRVCSLVKTPMVPPNNLGLDLAGKLVNETSYIGMIGSLMYLTATRPDIQFSIIICFDLKGYSDSDYAGYNMDRKITSCACQILGGKLVCCSAKKQQSIAMSSAEAKYVDVAGCCVSISWMKSQLSDYDIHYKMVPIFCDNTSAIAISNNPILHLRTKHIDIRYHFIRDYILKGDIELHLHLPL